MDIFKAEALEETPLSSEEVYNGGFLRVYKDEVTLPNGGRSSREYIKHVGAVCVAAMTDRGGIIIERQFRYPLGRVITELPAGKLNSKDEDPLLAAKRELREETGITAESFTLLGAYYPAAAYSDEVVWMYLAEGLNFGKRSLDEDEFLSVSEIPLSTLVSEIMDGKIPDGKTQAAVMRIWESRQS